MVESQCHGSCSCGQLSSLEDTRAQFLQLTKSPPLSILHSVLGPQAKLHLVGGSVRDILLGIGNSDLDLASKLPAEQALQILEAAQIRAVDTGLKHNTITAVVDGKNIEITTFRNPISNRPANSIEEDLGFRDFTVNSIAFSLDSHLFVDPFGGYADLAAGKLRAPGSAILRFQEDPLRMLRAVRFGPAQNRRVADDIIQACKSLKQDLGKISVERIREELKKVLVSPFAANGLAVIRDWGLLPYVLPELEPAVGFEQNDFHIHDVFEHTLWVVDRCPIDPILRLAGLFHDIGKPHTLSVDELGRRHFYSHEEVGMHITRDAMRRLKFSNDEIDAVSKLVRFHMRPIDCGAPGVRRLIRDLGENFEQWKQIKLADAPPKVEQQQIDAAFSRFMNLYEVEIKRQQGTPYGKLAIGGQDLIDLGMKPGKEMGQLLKKLVELVLDDPALNQKDTLLQQAKALLDESTELSKSSVSKQKR